MKTKLSTDSQISKLNHFSEIAKKAEKSENFATRLGALTIYAGMIDFYTIQAVRALEQVILKSSLHLGEEPPFKPHEDEFFYDLQIRTRKIRNEIKKRLPFKPLVNTRQDKAEEVTSRAEDFLNVLNKFLSYRNTLMHHLGNPKKDKKDIEELCDKAISKYKECMRCHKEFMEGIAPFTLTKKQIEHIYKK